MKVLNLWWKIYFFFICFLVGIGLIPTILGLVTGSMPWSNGIELISTALVLVGLFGFCWNKRIISPVFWKVVFFGVIIWDLVKIFFLSPPLPTHFVILGLLSVLPPALFLTP